VLCIYDKHKDDCKCKPPALASLIRANFSSSKESTYLIQIKMAAFSHGHAHASRLARGVKIVLLLLQWLWVEVLAEKKQKRTRLPFTEGVADALKDQLQQMHLDIDDLDTGKDYYLDMDELKAVFDTNHDNKITEEEIDKVKFFDLNGDGALLQDEMEFADSFNWALDTQFRSEDGDALLKDVNDLLPDGQDIDEKQLEAYDFNGDSQLSLDEVKLLVQVEKNDDDLIDANSDALGIANGLVGESHKLT
ncbi:unnamed protein product, partial [Amoebophrya sp. A120]